MSEMDVREVTVFRLIEERKNFYLLIHYMYHRNVIRVFERWCSAFLLHFIAFECVPIRFNTFRCVLMRFDVWFHLLIPESKHLTPKLNMPILLKRIFLIQHLLLPFSKQNINTPFNAVKWKCHSNFTFKRNQDVNLPKPKKKN